MQEAWCRLWQRLGAVGDAGIVFHDLLARYGEAGRAYHNLSHIEACLGELDACIDSDVIAYAPWFHDAVYDTRTKDNEARIAQLALKVARGAGLADLFGETAARLILATRHDAPPIVFDEQVLVDVDLSILGQGVERFDAYQREIRAEYTWVEVDAFRAGRRAVLERFLARPRIFLTQFFFERYETEARSNVERSLAAL